MHCCIRLLSLAYKHLSQQTGWAEISINVKKGKERWKRVTQGASNLLKQMRCQWQL